MPAWVLALMAFVAMEPITAATHRFVMHGVGAFLHRSHHRRRIGRFEANDAYPVMFAALVCLGLWAGFNRQGFDGLIPVGIGVTAYGLTYALVHDVYIHGRLSIFGRRQPALLEYLAAAHRLHHLYNDAPYGMLVPIVPRRVRRREAERATAPPGVSGQRVPATPPA